MKQRKYGRPVQNWHRPLPPWKLKRSFRRERAEDPAFDSRGQLRSRVPARSPDLSLVGRQQRRLYRSSGRVADYEVSNQPLLAWVRHQVFDSPGLETVMARAGLLTQLESAEEAVAAKPQRQDIQSRLNLFLEDLNDPRQLHSLQQKIGPLLHKLEAVRSVARQGAGENFATLVCLFSPFWVRCPQSWTGNNSLLEHLFCHFEVPSFLLNERLWQNTQVLSRNQQGRPDDQLVWMCWLILLGQGESLKRASRAFRAGLEPALQKRLYEVPENLAPAAALEYARCLHMGGSDEDYWLLRQYGIRLPEANESDSAAGRFRLGLVRWLFANQTEIPEEDTPALVQWATHEFMLAHQRGEAFSWKRRRPASTLAKARTFVQSSQLRMNGSVWGSHHWDWYCQDDSGQRWTMTELLTEYELWQEGAAMRHCVSSYADDCVDNRSAIFSLRLDGERCATVEVCPLSGALRQIQGPMNGLVDGAVRTVIDYWLDTVVYGG